MFVSGCRVTRAREKGLVKGDGLNNEPGLPVELTETLLIRNLVSLYISSYRGALLLPSWFGLWPAQGTKRSRVGPDVVLFKVSLRAIVKESKHESLLNLQALFNFVGHVR